MVPVSDNAAPSLEAPKPVPVPAAAVRRVKPQAAAVEVLDIPLEQIEEDPDNARLIFDPARIQARADSMKEVGQLQPAIVRRKPNLGPNSLVRFRLVDGALRFRAAPLAGLKTLRCEVHDLDDVQAALAAATANLQRDNLTEYEEARGYSHLIEISRQARKPLTMADVARLAGVAPNTVKNRLKILDLGDDIGHRIGQNGFGSVHAQALEPLVQHPDLLKPVLAAIDEGAGIPTAGNMRSFIRGALERAKVAVEPTTAIDWETRGSIPNFEKRVAALPHVELANEHGSPTVLIDPKILGENVRAWKADVRMRQAQAAEKERTAVAKRGSPPPGPKPQPKRAEDLAPYKVRDAQVQLVAQNAKELTKWNDEFQMALVGSFLRGAPAVTRKLDRQALLDASGLTDAEVESLLRFGNSNAVAKLWPKKRLPIQRLCMVMAAYSHWSSTQVQGRDASDPHWVDYLDTPWDKLFTGTSHASLKAKVLAEVKDELAAKPSGRGPQQVPRDAEGQRTDCEECGNPAIRVEAGIDVCGNPACLAKAQKRAGAGGHAKPAKVGKKAKASKSTKAKAKGAKKPRHDPPGVRKARSKLAQQRLG